MATVIEYGLVAGLVGVVVIGGVQEWAGDQTLYNEYSSLKDQLTQTAQKANDLTLGQRFDSCGKKLCAAGIVITVPENGYAALMVSSYDKPAHPGDRLTDSYDHHEEVPLWALHQ